MTLQAPRILLVDSYDSFTHNLAALCRQSIPNCHIHIIKNDELTLEELLPSLQYFSAIVVGPGPGSPDRKEDIGIVRDLWRLRNENILPIFGVCLGLQSLGIEFGAELKRLGTVKHGQVSRVSHTGSDIFQGVGDIQAVRYHSLHITISSPGDIQQLGWAEDDENGKVVMAIKHKHLPFWAVQYHPESIRTHGGGWEVLANFWKLAQEWAKQSSRRPTPWNIRIGEEFGASWPYICSHKIIPRLTDSAASSVLTAVLDLPHLPVTDICEYLGVSNELSRFVFLDSAASPGRFSIIGSLLPSSLQITYYVNDPYVSLSRGSVTTTEILGSLDIWQWLATYMRSKSVRGGSPSIPFWGGFIGYFGYEIGYPILQVPLAKRKERRHPDVNLVFVERSVVVDNENGTVYVQSLLPNDGAWIEQVRNDLSNRSKSNVKQTRRSSVLSVSPLSTIHLPDRQRYISRIEEAKEHLYAGDSYELCLTAQTKISIPYHQGKSSEISTSWERYQRLRATNPAPHSAYLRLHPTTLMSSSPERFLSYSRPPNPVYQLRPIKGTVKKGPAITRSVAEKALAGSPKEVAENLMIVDLIRHDLHGVLGENVTVPQFCGVEEYETVWQLVSVIEGKRDPEFSSRMDDQLGWNVLKSSLPPGSMTGAPKKRSVEILQNLEDSEREVYSGVFGYWDVGGGGDWSVTIRSCFKYDDLSTRSSSGATSSSSNEEWIIGAGGAITALSDPEAEWDEMILKLQSVLKSFGITPPASSL